MELRFRRWTLFLGFLCVLTGASLFAQESGSADQDSGKNVTLVRTYNIRKIYSHRLGYRIDIRDYQGKIRAIYAKASWFSNLEQRNPESDTFEVAATMNYLPASSGISSNYLTLRYEDGKLVSMVIDVDEPSQSKNSIWYRVMSHHENIDSKFDIKTVIFSAPPTPAQNN